MQTFILHTLGTTTNPVTLSLTQTILGDAYRVNAWTADEFFLSTAYQEYSEAEARYHELLNVFLPPAIVSPAAPK